MSRIVIVLPDPPLPFGNAAARWYYVLLGGLVERGHDVTALVACDGEADRSRTLERFPPGRFDVRLFEPAPPSVGLAAKLRTLKRPFSYRYSPAMKAELESVLARGFDFLHLEQLWSGWLGWEHAARSLVHLHYLYEIDLAEEPANTPGAVARKLMTRRAERALIRHFPNLSTLTPRLTDRVRQINPRANVHTVPLGMDLSLYPFEPSGGPPTRPVVGLVGSFHWRPSYSAGVRLLTRLWPEIKRLVPEATLQIVGRKAKSALGPMALGPDISVDEDVPDTLPYFRKMDVLLYAPSRGSGMKVKVLEAMALGVPVVTTAEGVEGLPAEDGVHAGVTEDDASLIERTVALLRDPALAGRRRAEARPLIERQCGPGPVLDRLEEVYRTIRPTPDRDPV